MVNPTSTWSAANYGTIGSFVSGLAGDVLQMLNAQSGERILDVGCGNGVLTEQIAATGAEVVGVDASAELVEQARGRGLQVHLLDAADMSFDEEFDALFSNAALHWMLDPDRVAQRMFDALKPGGRFVAEFGGFGNIAAIRTALSAVLGRRGLLDRREDGPTDQYYPTVAQYTQVLESAGFTEVTGELVPRPTRLDHGMVAWLTTFRSGLLDALDVQGQTRRFVFAETADLLAPSLLDNDGVWWADYVRIRVSARRPT
jgi:trans-aconitate methyltransferase